MSGEIVKQYCHHESRRAVPMSVPVCEWFLAIVAEEDCYVGGLISPFRQPVFSACRVYWIVEGFRRPRALFLPDSHIRFWLWCVCLRGRSKTPFM